MEWAQNGLNSLDPITGKYSSITLASARNLVNNVIEDDQVYCTIHAFEEEIFLEWIAGSWRLCFSCEDDEVFIETIVDRKSTFASYVQGKDVIPYEQLKLSVNQLTYCVNKINPNWKEQFISSL
jgi:hypothetical protein